MIKPHLIFELGLYQEIEIKGLSFERKRMVEQLHWGGGTLTFLNQDEIHNLMTHLRAFFNLLDNDCGDYSIEIDPRECTKQKLQFVTLRRLQSY